MSDDRTVYLELRHLGNGWVIGTTDQMYAVNDPAGLRETLTYFAEWFPDALMEKGFAVVAASSKEALDRE